MNLERKPTLESLAGRTSRHGRVMAVSMMKDEGPYLLEWIAHHITVGFTDILVYTNDCSDGTDTMLKRLEALGIALHRENRIPEGIKPQPSAIKHAQAEPSIAAADWVMLFDADEFLCLRHGHGTLDPMLDEVVAQGANGVVITWRIFGSGGVVEWSRAPVTEQYLMAAPPSWNKGWGVKTLFQFDPKVWKLGIHRPKMKNKVLDTDFPAQVRWLNGSGRPMEDYFKFRGWRSITRTVGYDWAQMNHYAIKSVDAYALRRLRGNVNAKKDKYNADYWSLQDRNEVRDETMLRYSEPRRLIFEALLSDPELRALHFAAVERAEAALAEIKATAAYLDLVAGLAEASRVPIEAVSAKPPVARDPAKIAAKMSDVEKRSVARRTTELEKPQDVRDLPPPDLYVRGTPAPLDEAVAWHLNHSLTLPAAPGLFTPAALPLVEAGKFQRNLARMLPTLVAGPVVEIGAATGFLGLHLRKSGFDVVQVESDLGFARAFEVVAARAGITTVLIATPPASADTLILGDPGLDIAAIAALAEATKARLVIVTGRLWADRYPDRALLTDRLAEVGLTTPVPLDAAYALGFSRG